MILKAYAIYDSKSEAYMQPWFMQARGQAIRAFSDLVNDQQSSISRHPGDYTLFEIGQWDDQSGHFSQEGIHVNLGVAVEFKTQAPDVPLYPEEKSE